MLEMDTAVILNYVNRMNNRVFLCLRKFAVVSIILGMLFNFLTQ